MSDHDREGHDLASQIARAYRSITPKRKRKPKTKRVNDVTKGEDATAVGDVMKHIIKDMGWEKDLAVRTLFSSWDRLVGTEVAQHSKPVSFRDGEVIVETTTTAWATNLKFLAPNIVARLNEELGDGSVLRIVVRGPNAPSWKKGPRSAPGRGPRDTYG